MVGVQSTTQAYNQAVLDSLVARGVNPIGEGMYPPGTQKGHNRGLDPIELELQMVVNYYQYVGA